jgi:hypothetical protein
MARVGAFVADDTSKTTDLVTDAFAVVRGERGSEADASGGRRRGCGSHWAGVQLSPRHRDGSLN